MEVGGAGLQACLRKDLRLFLQDDRVTSGGKVGSILRMNEDRTCTIAFESCQQEGTLTPSASSGSAFTVSAGQRVRIQGLSSENGMKLNGKSGAVSAKSGSNERVVVQVDETGNMVSIHPQNLMALSPVGVEERVSTEHCEMLEPQGNFRKKRRTESSQEFLRWTGTCVVNANGQCRLQESRFMASAREGVHHVCQIVETGPLPSGVAVTGLEMSVEGMDQGWGNTGDSGVVLSVIRAETFQGQTLGQDEEPIAKVWYDRRRQKSRSHTTGLQQVVGALAPQPGDRLKASLHCPSYPGWHATAENIKVRLYFTSEQEVELPGTLPSDWQSNASEAFDVLWSGMVRDADIDVDISHLSLQGQAKQRVWSEPDFGTNPVQPVLPRLLEIRSGGLSKGAEDLLRKLDLNTMGAGAPNDPSLRRKHYDRMRWLVHRTLDAVEKHSNELLELVCVHYAEASSECVYRWDREIANMHDMVTGDFVGNDSKTPEEEVLRILCARRRQIAENVLHKTKGRIRNDELHFETFFYGAIHFGLPEQIDAARDPNRLNYRALNLVRMEDVQAELISAYTPSKIRQIIRNDILESKLPRSQDVRDKITAWMKEHIPAGFPTSASAAERQEEWLFNWCHDDNFRMTDQAINFMLCGMHIFRADRVVCWSENLVEHQCEHVSAPSVPIERTESTERATCSLQ